MCVRGVLRLLLTTRTMPLLAAQGNLEEAEALYRQALEFSQKVMGEEHPYVGTALRYLACMLHDQGHTEEAARMGKQALAIFEKALGPDHPDTQEAREEWE